MAAIAKVKASGVRAVFQHANRTEDDGHEHSNESIDLSRTKNNYRIKNGNLKDFRKRLEDVFYIKRTDNVTFAEAVVTLPKDVKPEDERQFFQSCYEFFSDDFGEDNVIYATVHKDELTPHLHLGFVPTVKEDTNEIYSNVPRLRNSLEKWREKHGEYPQERIQVGKCITRQYLWELHGRLQYKVDKDLGYHVSVNNGATAHGNKTVLELKVKDLQEEKDALEKSIGSIKNDARTVKQSLTQAGITTDQFGLYPLLQKIEELQEQNQALMDIIARNNYTYRPNELRKKKEYMTASSSAVSVFEGSLVDEQLPENAVVVIEIPKNRPDSPQQALINADFDLRQIVTFAKNSNEAVRIKRSRTSDKWFVTIKTDENEQATINNLMLLENVLREIEDLKERRVYMDRMESDRYDLAKSILTSSNITASYFEKKSTLDKILGNEQEKNMEKE